MKLQILCNLSIQSKIWRNVKSCVILHTQQNCASWKMCSSYFAIHLRITWDKRVFKNGSSKICRRQPLKNLKRYGLPKADCTPSIFLKPVFHKFYLVHSWILYPVLSIKGWENSVFPCSVHPTVNLSAWRAKDTIVTLMYFFRLFTETIDPERKVFLSKLHEQCCQSWRNPWGIVNIHFVT